MKLRYNVKWYCHIRKRAKVNSIKGKNLKSTAYVTKIEAKISLCSFCFNTKCKIEKESTRKRHKDLIDN